MRAIGKAFLPTTVLVVAVLLGIGRSARAVDFTADLYEMSRDTTVVHKIYVKPPNYKLVFNGRYGTTSVVSDQVNGVHTVMQDYKGEYNFFPSNSNSVLKRDPIEAAYHTARTFEKEPIGKETINGYECDKYLYKADTIDLMVEWFSPYLNFPLKMQSLRYGVNEKTLEFRYIMEGDLDPAMFEIPEGYVRYQENPISLPDWEGLLPEARVEEAPYLGQLEPGELVRFKIVPGKAYLIKGEPYGWEDDQGDFEALAMPFKDGRPVGDNSIYRIHRLRPETWIPVTHSVIEADEVVVGSRSGPMAVEVKTVDQFEKTLAPGEELRVPIRPAEQTRWRAINMADGPSAYSWTWYDKGEALSAEATQPDKFRHWTLRDKDELDWRSIRLYGDEVVIRCDSGKVHVKFGQLYQELVE